MDKLRQLFGANLEELAGARVSGHFRLTERAINRVIADQLRTSSAPVDALEIRVRNGGEFVARVVLRRPRFVPPIIVTACIERQPDFPGSPVLVLRWALPGMWLIGAMARPIVALMKVAPPGVGIDGHHVFVDVARLMQEHGAGAFVEHVHLLRVDTEDGALVVTVDLRADDARISVPGGSPSSGSRAEPPA
jgi:hypothetical protein